MEKFNGRDFDVIAFDADDTLWHNEEFFRESEVKIIDAICKFKISNKSREELMASFSDLIISNLDMYGYGIKSFILSTVEFALKEGGDRVKGSEIEELIGYGREQLLYPVTPIDYVVDILKELQGRYRLVILTKGDLLEQTNKIKRSEIGDYFNDIEVLYEKCEETYSIAFKKLDIDPKRLLMVGNSFKSDILPVLNLGCKALYIPSGSVWEHERVPEIEHDNLIKGASLKRLLEIC